MAHPEKEDARTVHAIDNAAINNADLDLESEVKVQVHARTFLAVAVRLNRHGQSRR